MTKTKESVFEDIIGQVAAKRKLEFFLDVYGKTHIVPPLLAIAPRGCGKTTLCKAFARRLYRAGEDRPKTFIEINCSTLKNVKQFFNQVIIPHVVDREVTILFDEASELPHDLKMALLTILNPNPEHKNTFSIDDYTVDFDLRQITWLFATTEPQKIFHALLNRLERVTLSEYTEEELAKVVMKNLKGVDIAEKTLIDIASVLRGNPRDAQKLGANVRSYLDVHGKKRFTTEDWEEMKEILNIYPLGLSVNEVNILRKLKKHGALSLTNLSAKTMESRESLQKDAEMFLLRNSLLSIGQNGREITALGLDYLKKLDVKK
jgi:Holliday junction resolvasome RuvABC ATP-dependent DNA helicase subunit